MADEPTFVELAPNRRDLVAATAKAALGAVPGVGSLLAELIENVIPNQRIDRLAKFAETLDRKLQSIEDQLVNTHIKDESFCDLVEEGCRQAARSLSDERREYIASVIANGLSGEEADFIESKHLLSILGEVNDIEVVWLRYFLGVYGEDQEYRAKHSQVLAPVVATTGSEQEVVDKQTLQRSYKEHLTRLGLLKERYRTDIKTRLPEFDRDGSMKVTGYEITSLGRLLLRHIGLGEDGDEE